MSDIVIEAENLGKKYTIGHQASNGRYVALRDVVMQNARRFWRGTKNLVQGKPIVQGDDLEEVWALKDVNFEIQRGEVVGIIGPNGAGKSTLLKILSRITEPSAGRVTLKGRVASLLEVGTGFHPELTGRENIYLNGAILGMTRAEVKHKFDEIVAFAEIEKFLDTPVKRYSSGMYVRLAFAVAAHLEPEILLVDEVLAVGDAGFQKKCLGKMENVARGGRTVLFVSHNMAAIQSLCKRSIVLEKGNIVVDGTSSEAIQKYLQEASKHETFSRSVREGKPTIIAGRLAPPKDEATVVHIELDIYSDTSHHLGLDLRLKDSVGTPVGFGTFGTIRPQEMIELKKGVSHICFNLVTSQFASGSYFISLDLNRPGIGIYDRVEDCLSFDLKPALVEGTIYPFTQEWRYGSVSLALTDFSITNGPKN